MGEPKQKKRHRKAEIEKVINEAFVDFDDEAYRLEQVWKVKISNVIFLC